MRSEPLNDPLRFSLPGSSDLRNRTRTKEYSQPGKARPSCSSEWPGFCISSPSARLKWRVNAVTSRSESCPCGSGEKFKNCCRSKPKPQMRHPQGPPPEVIAKAVLEIQRKQRAQRKRKAKDAIVSSGERRSNGRNTEGVQDEANSRWSLRGDSAVHMS
jgi:hypothetical protein